MLINKRLLVVLGGTAWLAAGCSDIMGPPEKLEELPRQLTVAEREVISASNDFSFRLLRQVLSGEDLGAGNVFISPFSVSMALGMALNGAAGETFDSMRATLGFGGLEQAEINASYRDLTSLLLGLDERTELRIANSVWARQGFPIYESFFRTARDYFGAEARELDFTSPTARESINGWVRDATNGRIEEIVDEITDEILFLINAVYFKGEWTNRFDPSNTRPDPFFLEGAADPVQVETMHARDVDVGLFNVGDGIEGGELPYGNQAFTMVLVMPPRGGSVDDLVASLDADAWQSWMERIDYRKGPVALPKWEMEYEARLDTALIDMGMGVAFDPARADFSRLTPDPRGVFISSVAHKTFLKVDEEGTEAAAATSVGFTPASAPDGLTVDRPFLVVIREQLSGTVLFVGVVRDPR